MSAISNTASQHMPKRDQHFDRMRRKARARGARHMVSQGLTLYYQSLVHRVVDDTPSYVERLMQQAQRKRAGQIAAHSATGRRG